MSIEAAPSSGSSFVGFNYIEEGKDKVVIKHHGHHHPLVKLKKSFQYEDYQGYCNGCGSLVERNSEFMICIEDDCDFLLHEFCALLSNRDTLHHPQHTCPLKLTQSKGSFKCNVCFVEFLEDVVAVNFSLMHYRCKDCNFGVDLRCASMVFLITVPYHQHPLTPKFLHLNQLISCSVCGENRRKKPGIVSFECKICASFSIHQECSTLPCTLYHDSHDHILHIKTCYQKLILRNSSWVSCGICKGYIKLQLTFYYCCEACQYFIHVHCSSKKWDRKIEKPPVRFGELMKFPLPSIESVDQTLSHFIKQICLYHDHEQGETSRSSSEELDTDVHDHEPGEISRSSSEEIDTVVYDLEQEKTSSKELFDSVLHDHPLVLNNNNHSSDVHDHETGKTSRSSNSKELDTDVLNNAAAFCKACTLSVLGDAPFYSCTESSCDFISHKWCAKLPHFFEQKYPSTGHETLTFDLLTNSGNFLCAACSTIGKGIAYKCTVHENYYIHVKCMSLPRYVKHETHKHPLILFDYPETGLRGCYACHEDKKSCTYGCRACNFSLHISCLFLPREFSYKYDKHGFKLTYCPPKLKYEPPSFTDHVNESDDPDEPAGEYCELCEEEMDSVQWFYHCNECKRYSHRTCAKWNFNLF